MQDVDWSFDCVGSARSSARAARHLKLALLRSELQTAASERKEGELERSSLLIPLWRTRQDCGDHWVDPHQSLSHAHTHPSFRSPPSMSHRWCVSGGSILGVSSTDRTTGRETLWNGWERKGQETCRIWTDNIHLDSFLGEIISLKKKKNKKKKGGNLNNPCVGERLWDAVVVIQAGY